MIQIRLNHKLLEKHIDEISKSLKKRIDNKLKTKLWQYEIDCLQYIQTNLKDILKANDKRLKFYIGYFKTNFPKAIGRPNTKAKQWTRLYKILRQDIFEKEYDNWTKKTKYNAYSFVGQLEITTCPYCNRNYTFIVDDKHHKLRPEIDHFYPKSLYPFLTMSFYNLIPSCPICNHTKKDKDSYQENLINPYEYQKNDFKFTYYPLNIDFHAVTSNQYNFENFEIKFENNNKNIDIFKLEELYKQHKDIVLDLLIKKAYYPKSYIKELEKFGFAPDSIYRYLLCNYKNEKDLHKRPLSKLIKDISEELKLVP